MGGVGFIEVDWEVTGWFGDDWGIGGWGCWASIPRSRFPPFWLVKGWQALGDLYRSLDPKGSAVERTVEPTSTRRAP